MIRGLISLLLEVIYRLGRGQYLTLKAAGPAIT